MQTHTGAVMEWVKPGRAHTHAPLCAVEQALSNRSAETTETPTCTPCVSVEEGRTEDGSESRRGSLYVVQVHIPLVETHIGVTDLCVYLSLE